MKSERLFVLTAAGMAMLAAGSIRAAATSEAQAVAAAGSLAAASRDLGELAAQTRARLRRTPGVPNPPLPQAGLFTDTPEEIILKFIADNRQAILDIPGIMSVSGGTPDGSPTIALELDSRHDPKEVVSRFRSRFSEARSWFVWWHAANGRSGWDSRAALPFPPDGSAARPKTK